VLSVFGRMLWTWSVHACWRGVCGSFARWVGAASGRFDCRRGGDACQTCAVWAKLLISWMPAFSWACGLVRLAIVVILVGPFSRVSG